MLFGIKGHLKPKVKKSIMFLETLKKSEFKTLDGLELKLANYGTDNDEYGALSKEILNCKIAIESHKKTITLFGLINRSTLTQPDCKWLYGRKIELGHLDPALQFVIESVLPKTMLINQTKKEQKDRLHSGLLYQAIHYNMKQRSQTLETKNEHTAEIPGPKPATATLKL
jgi:hypothetical protein